MYLLLLLYIIYIYLCLQGATVGICFTQHRFVKHFEKIQFNEIKADLEDKKLIGLAITVK